MTQARIEQAPSYNTGLKGKNKTKRPFPQLLLFQLKEMS